ncbi:hypothetical protein BD769DRAFT_1772661 [Suillus cothurnatus]|nr:hypothetical protein BD769DRAFT_1772661 [Suillus cothurnatus]
MAPLHTRLIAGKGALARLGKYWYPVRLIQSYGATSLPATARNRSKEISWTNTGRTKSRGVEFVQVEKWLGGMPLVHAFTLVVAHRKAGDFKKHVQARNEEWNNSELLKMAWADLMISYPADSFMADQGCSKILKKQDLQWGLDAGQHHRWWGVYLNIPNEWVIERDYSDTELERGPLFSDNSDNATSADELSGVVAPS